MYEYMVRLTATGKTATWMTRRKMYVVKKGGMI